MESTDEGNSKLLVAITALVVLSALGVATYYYTGAKAPVVVPEINTGPDVGAEISGAVETPAEKLPETNPFKGYKNPFE